MTQASRRRSRSAPVTTRFAPSPTGHLHLGNVRTALLNWLYARKYGGRFLLRFEDTDAARTRMAFAEGIQEDLRWLGLDWDGKPRFQSTRRRAHQAALDALAARGLAYRCFCSERQLAAERRQAAARGRPPRYAGRCRRLAAAEAEARAASGEAHVWRLAAHGTEGTVVVRDELRGEVRFARADLDDPVIVRADGRFTFLLPNAVDDAEDGITHVIRGDDHLTNSAYQVWLLQQLGYEAPVYLHHGLLLGPDGSKLSKRAGSTAVRELRAQGLLPAALVQAMARVGHPNLPPEAAPDELAAHFQPRRLSTAAVRWSTAELWRWHAILLSKQPRAQLAALLAAHFPGVEMSRLAAFAELIRANLSRAEDALAFRRLLDAHAEPSAEAEQVMRAAGRPFFEAALDRWRSAKAWEPWVERLKRQSGKRGKALFLPLRAALTGALHGPQMRQVVAFLGVEGVAERLQDTLARIP